MADAVPTPPPLPAELPPAPPARKAPLRIVGVLIAVAVGVAAAFGVDVCGTLASLGVHLDACQVTP